MGMSLGIGLGLSHALRPAAPAAPVISLAAGSAGYQGSVYTASVPGGQWYADGAAIIGATGQTWTRPAGYGSAVITYRVGGLVSNAIQMWTPTAAPPTAGYDPSNPANITATGGAVQALADSFGGWGLTQDIGANQPTTGTRSIGGINVLDFDGTGDVIAKTTGPAVGASNTLMAAVVDFDNVSITQNIFTGRSSNNTTFGFVSFYGTLAYTQSTSYPSYAGAKVDMSTGPQIITGYTTGGVSYIRKNGIVSATTGTPSAIGSFDYWGISGASLANMGFGEGYVWLNYSESIRDRIEGYLAHKYGLAGSLPAAHPYKSADSMRVQ